MLSDERLVELVREGDLAAFDELYARYERPLFGFVLRYVGNAQDAEEIFHEAFMRLLKVPPTSGSFRAWVYQVSRNLCLNRLRSLRRERLALDALELPVNDETPDPSRASELAVAVSRLPFVLSEVYGLRVSGLAYDEMAQVLEIPVGTVRSRMHEMVKRLKKEMKSWNVG